jgi:predicted PurR-regulated permease PerM
MDVRMNRYLRMVLSVLVTLLCLYLIGLLREFFHDIWVVLRALVIPFAASLVVAYILQPIVELLVRRKVPRGIAIALIYFTFVLVVIVIALNCIPLITKQLTELGSHLPDLVRRADAWIDQMAAHKKYLPQSLRVAVESILNQLQKGILDYSGHVFQLITNTVSAIFIAFVVPFLVFYMLKDAKAIGRVIVHLAPKRHREATRVILRGVDETLGKYVRGQLLVMLVVGILTYAGLLIVRMPYALTLASFVGLMDLVPYIGPFIGAAPAVILALFISPPMAIKVLLVNMIVQQVEGNLISPQIMGRTLDLHPMLIVAALLIGGEIGGVLGLVVAVPLTAAIKVTWRHIKDMRDDSERPPKPPGTA